MIKHTLEALVLALAVGSTHCATNTTTITIPASSSHDGKYDSIDNDVNQEDIDKLKSVSYMVISESKYKTAEGEEVAFHSIGTAVMYRNTEEKTYMVTANHVVENEEVMYDFFGRKYEKLSEQFFLLEDQEVDTLHDCLRRLSETKENAFYIKDSSGKKKEVLNYIVRTSQEMAVILDLLRPQKIEIVAQNETKDLAIISVPKLSQSLPYAIGNAAELQTQNIVYVTGWPLGLVKNVTQGHITSVHDSRLDREDIETTFLSDAAISPGNSGGGIFAVRDGKFELVGITTARYIGGDAMYIGVKINGISDVFKEESILCIDEWTCR